jgi:hypothetical protein
MCIVNISKYLHNQRRGSQVRCKVLVKRVRLERVYFAIITHARIAAATFEINQTVCTARTDIFAIIEIENEIDVLLV